MGPYGTAGPLPLTTCQCCMHQPGMKCVESQACMCRSANHNCTSGFPSENCCNRGPTRNHRPGGRPRDPTALRLTSNVNQKIKEAQKSAPILCQATPWYCFTHTSQTSHLTSSQTERSGRPYWIVPKLPTQTNRSTIPPPPTPPHQRQSGGAKEIQIAH